MSELKSHLRKMQQINVYSVAGTSRVSTQAEKFTLATGREVLHMYTVVDTDSSGINYGQVSLRLECRINFFRYIHYLGQN